LRGLNTLGWRIVEVKRPYGAGLRISEVVALKVGDIDSRAYAAAGRAGQGPQGPNAMLSPQLLELLRDWWRDDDPVARRGNQCIRERRCVAN